MKQIALLLFCGLLLVACRTSELWVDLNSNGAMELYEDPGEKRRITLRVPVKELATFSVEEKAFLTRPGNYEIMVGNSSGNFYFKEHINIH